MYEYGLLDDINLTEETFRQKVMDFAQREKMDRLTAMLYFVLEKLHENKITPNYDYFYSLGKKLKFFAGVNTWFERLNDYAKSKNIQLEHYLITSGNKEVINGCEIAKNFKEIYGCEFFYKDEIAIAPKLAMNYTAKTQFLFRIHKGIFKPWLEEELNRKWQEKDCYVSFKNMVYFGDGLTDVACMQIVKSKGGMVIGIKNERNPERGKILLEDKRIDYLVNGNYEKGSEIESIAQKIIDFSSVRYDLVK